MLDVIRQMYSVSPVHRCSILWGPVAVMNVLDSYASPPLHGIRQRVLYLPGLFRAEAINF